MQMNNSQLSAIQESQQQQQKMTDEIYMRLALKEAAKCTSIPSAFNVGAILLITNPNSLGSDLVLDKTETQDNGQGGGDWSNLSKMKVDFISGFSRELPGNTHAEECCLIKYKERSVAPFTGLGHAKTESSDEKQQYLTMYTTMEPCGQRLSGKKCCAELIIEAGIQRVVQGVKEPTKFVGDSKGTDMLREAGIIVFYLEGFEEEALRLSGH